MGAAAEVQVHIPESAFVEQRSQRSPVPVIHTEDYAQDISRQASGLQNLPRRKPLDGGRRNMSESSHHRVTSDNLQAVSHKDNTSQERAMRHTSASFAEQEQPVENYEPLRYFHQPQDEPDMRALDKRASRLTIGTYQSDGSNGSDPNRHYLQDPATVRQSAFGRNLARPDSVVSSTSDLRGRTASPHLSPGRPASRHSRSPDARPLSYVDLLNVPYPQNAPSGAEQLVNAGLRNVVGNNASLLSTRKTLDMYRANVKKTNDPAIQYEFAVFMVGAAQEEGLEAELADNQLKGKTSPRDDLLKEAKNILQKLSDRSYPFAQYYLADGYASGLFNKGREDWDRAFPLFVAASKHGHAEAGYRTALCYEFGWGSKIEPMKAVQFYQQAASKNHPGAMLRLGRACLTGEMGLTKRYREGIRWLKRAAESADHQYNQAPFDLGQLHETGFGPDVFKDEAYAAQLYTKAADLGHIEANFRLGEAYEYGQMNCPKDPALSIHFYTGAAEQDHAPSQMALCAWYMVGVENVLEKDESEAYEWAKRAAQHGLPKAQYTLGYFTEMGIGCRRDPLEANVWYVRAADQGEERARHRIHAIQAASTGADPMTAAANDRSNGQGEFMTRPENVDCTDWNQVLRRRRNSAFSRRYVMTR
jgi:TPR repeat protein